jgi:hypothetical protein
MIGSSRAMHCVIRHITSIECASGQSFSNHLTHAMRPTGCADTMLPFLLQECIAPNKATNAYIISCECLYKWRTR